MVQKPFSRIFSNVDDQSSANATEVRDNTSKKKRKAPLYETMSSENKNDGGLGSYYVSNHVPIFRENLKHHIERN